ncbi:hypothetical protein M2338_002537 [Sphingobium sp. B2D3B]|nr:hypothetical protein [Sphingobium sp. B2D3B]MCW2400052.1 hypothetical protein [Sphingobium sp. B2D3C]
MMTVRTVLISCTALALAGLAVPAQAEGLGAEGNYARANGRWGAELGAGYAVDFAGFSLTPGAGVYLRDGGTAAYGRVEAAYQIPMSLRIGIGARISGEEPRVYGTVAMPVLPRVAVKGNVGDRYVSVGLTVGY